ncbi:hypothetical protein QTO34_013143 [Cnephaeus nilssonii]|uniref:Modulator of smoothened protein n=1 Tax=Cnephaeus nilssonii TaxID=3371016 RepID=A0AA40I7I8_CNENI|nr:hypothetical protein QTO34_013143 [Eptesicus nilssonii]
MAGIGCGGMVDQGRLGQQLLLAPADSTGPTRTHCWHRLQSLCAISMCKWGRHRQCMKAAVAGERGCQQNGDQEPRGEEPGGDAAHSSFQGALTVGLVRQCQTIHGRDRTCVPPRLPPEWVTTLFFIIMGIISLTVTCGLLVASHWRREATKYARWIAFTGMILFCMAALIFPIGFYINEVGGQPYKLPNNTVVGSSYVLFVLSIFFTIVGLLFAGKVCLPG